MFVSVNVMNSEIKSDVASSVILALLASGLASRWFAYVDDLTLY